MAKAMQSMSQYPSENRRPGQRLWAAQNGVQTGSAMGFFESEIVQDEAKRLFGDYQSLMQLGGEYGKFDREGKKLFIERMRNLRMLRYRVFMKRFELSEDFQAKLTVEQLRTQLSQFMPSRPSRCLSGRTSRSSA